MVKWRHLWLDVRCLSSTWMKMIFDEQFFGVNMQSFTCARKWFKCRNVWNLFPSTKKSLRVKSIEELASKFKELVKDDFLPLLRRQERTFRMQPSRRLFPCLRFCSAICDCSKLYRWSVTNPSHNLGCPITEKTFSRSNAFLNTWLKTSGNFQRTVPRNLFKSWAWKIITFDFLVT